MRRTIVSAGLLLFVTSQVAPAQDSRDSSKLRAASSNVSVRLRDGSTIFGQLERFDGDSLVLMSLSGRLAISAVNVQNVRDAGAAHVGTDGKTEYWYANANTTRLFFGPTGRTMAKGEKYFAVHEVVMASVGMGITSRIQLGGGSFIVPNSDLWFVLPKVGVVQTESFNLAVGSLYGGIGDNTGGIGYAVGTFGSTDRSVTLGLGQGIVGSKVEGKPVVMLGGEFRVSRRISFASENYFGAAFSEPLVSYGMRFLGEQFTFDLAFLNATKHAVFPGIPYVDFVLKW